ncbi:MAG TPA: RNase A-like domain-containing protein [Isosphaeraceae bacterium]|jgi:hypothetical protein
MRVGRHGGGEDDPAFYTASEPVGQGVARATNALTQMSKVRVVLKMQSYQGKLYYILTSFPEP